jgi:hypothetical protein
MAGARHFFQRKTLGSHQLIQLFPATIKHVIKKNFVTVVEKAAKKLD